MRFEGFLPVVVKEEFRVVQPGAEHALVADLHVFEGFRAAVPHGEEIGHEAAVFGVHRIVALVVAHGGDDGRRGELHEVRVDASVKRRGVFHDVVDFFEEVRIRPDFAAELGRGIEEALPDHFAAFVLIDDDEGAAHGFFIVRGCFDDHRLFAKHAVAAARASALHAGDLHGDHVFAAEGDEPADGADEFHVFAAPVHATREGQAEHDVREDLREDVRHGLALIDDFRPHVIAVFHEGRRVHARSPGESLRRAGGLPLRVERRLDGGAALFHRFVRLPGPRRPRRAPRGAGAWRRR